MFLKKVKVFKAGKMENSNNRIFNEINAWNQKVASLKEVFGNHVTDYRYLVRAKLDHFKDINAKYKSPANQDEKIARKILQAEIRRLEKMAFPNAIERSVRKAIENIGGIVRQFRGKARSEQQFEMKNEVIRKTKSENLSVPEKNLNKSVGQYNKNLKAVKDDELLPKLREGKGKGLKM